MKTFGLMFLMTPSACELFDPGTGAVQVDEPFQLSYMDKVVVKGEGLTIIFYGLEDLRCAPDAFCLWPGWVAIQLKLETKAEKVVVDLGGAVNTLGYRIALLNIEPPAANLGVTIPDEDYVATLEVTKL